MVKISKLCRKRLTKSKEDFDFTDFGIISKSWLKMKEISIFKVDIKNFEIISKKLTKSEEDFDF